MSDLEPPNQFIPGIRWALSSVFLFVFVLIAAEKISSGEYNQATVFGLLSVITFLVIIYWKNMSSVISRRVNLAWLFIVVGASCLCAGIYILATAGTLQTGTTQTAEKRAEDLAQQNEALKNEIEKVKHETAAAAQKIVSESANQNDAIKSELEKSRSENLSLKQAHDNKVELQSGPIVYRRLTPNQIKYLADHIHELKSNLGTFTLTSPTVDSSGEANQYRGDFAEAFGRAGVPIQAAGQITSGPDQTGLMLAIPDVNLPSLVIQKLRSVLEGAGLQVSYIQITKNDTQGAADTALFIGPKEF